MSKFSEKVKSLFSRRKPVTTEDAADIADWVNEGGALHPDGPPKVVDEPQRKPGTD
ncbi:hypothetical protein [Rhodococcus sp. NPDC058514]|uniref:hypothetical protein n=1 Tax=unclassified Rhodococcus (in: high G+C Gram-positive bacteria) TaxID=192944 RepID=UPI0036568DB5